MVAEQGIPADVKKLAGRWMRTALVAGLRNNGSIQAQQAIEPLLDLVPNRISNGRLQFYFPQRACFRRGFMGGFFGGGRCIVCRDSVFSERRACALAELLDKFKGE